ncbi:DUF2512 family protein [Desulforamulus aquiferis]|uniref:DUF2512 family protein n=1 Tax=Desulforamulus aquiferis TaxID=1397668 RepID=A0AAW7ZEU1_9FIRM|nr:DUF2512 family protein [Desulforamulus aquiferis]MDO7787794.1 DUF2512 family protein [Desulforamulus aquiferis]RYD02219.1 hypothetical protein N752_25750 [Desulforamulus aquiferis]
MNSIFLSLAIKFFMILVTAWIAITFIAANSWSWALAVAVIVTVATYFAGDRFILTRYGNPSATIIEGVLAAFILLIIDFASADLRLTIMSYIIFGLLIAVGEYFFHRYLVEADIVETK